MGRKLERRQLAAIAALLTAPTIETAAREAGVSERTLRRWMKLPEFRDSLREAQRCAFDEAVGELHALAREAADTLRRNMTCGHAATETRAALGVYAQAFKSREFELLDRLERLEELLESRDKER